MSPSAKKTLRTVLYNTLKLATNVSYIVPRNGGARTPVLLYHRVTPLLYKKPLPYAIVYPEAFDRQMGYLSENFDVVTVGEYLDRLSNGGLTGREACVTFDDGFKDNYIYALPILKKHGIRATFFLTTRFIGSKKPFPWMKLDEPAKKDMTVNRERWLPLSWKDIDEMARAGMEFGTHTHTHSDSLSNMSDRAAEKEIVDSTRTFEKRMGRAPEIFSYPHGTFKDYTEAHVKMLKKQNYRAALTTNTGRCAPGDDLYRLKRIIIYEEDSLWEFRKKLSGAYDIVEHLQKLWLNVTGSRKYEDYA